MARVKGMQFQIKKGQVVKTFRSRGDAAEYLEVPDWTLKTAMKKGEGVDGWTLSYVPRAPQHSALSTQHSKPPKAHCPSPMASTSLAPLSPLPSPLTPIPSTPVPVSDVLSTLATLHAKNIQITFEPGKTTITIAELCASKAA